ncbi:MAG: hypothetical protein LBV55_02775 [Acholeplasmatales bacterium]|jgi:hypothetical protein|nr:hypothetical protein [Acholeplasmatales bacterium]
MGLDMYLYKVKRSGDFPNRLFVKICWHLFSLELINNQKLGEYFQDYTYKVDVDGVEEEHLVCKIGYWRKANMIHNWIYENCATTHQADYDLIIVERTKLMELLDICRIILQAKEEILNGNSSKAKELLPTKSGFFFGSLEYNQGYIEDLEHSVKILETTLHNLTEQEDVFYLADY